MRVAVRASKRVAAAAATALLALTVSACGAKQSPLAYRSPQSHQISLLWWWMLGVATVVFLGAVALLTIAWWRRATPGLPLFGQREDISQGLVLLFGIGIPIVVLSALFAVANVYVIGRSEAPNPSSTAMTVEVIGHQWWWEVRYPATAGAVTANEIHIPVGTRVNVVARTADVIHSFWVPQLARKIDMVPGRANRVLLYASRAGLYRGQCAEFCGLQHANMALYVVAEPEAQFRTWLAREATSTPRPASGAARAGERSFMTSQCASCHQIRGTQAAATVGPDLTHLSSRATIAAGVIPNDPTHLREWVQNPQSFKPGSRMPNLGLSRAQIDSIVSYLETLK